MNRSFGRIAQQMPYRRRFLSPIRARVEVPCIPYEAFESTAGRTVKLWSLARLVESIRAYVFYPLQKAQDSSDMRSLADFHKCLENNFFFIAGANIQIRQEFHSSEYPKFPLYFDIVLDHVGSASKSITFSLCHPDLTFPYVTCKVADVLVASDNRKPTAYPDWFQTNYATLCQGDKTAPFEPLRKPENSKALTNSWQVQQGETDSYFHLNWSSYIKYCAESSNLNVYQRKYPKISKEHTSSGVKSFVATFKREATLGDILTLESWEGEDRNVLEFDLINDETSCFQARMEFYDPESETNH